MEVFFSLNSNARLGNGEWMVVEADESDGSFEKLNPTAAIITIDLEHLDYHKNEYNLENAFTILFHQYHFMDLFVYALIIIEHKS